MGINIKRQDVVETARALAKVQGMTMTDAIGDAVREKLEQINYRKGLAKRLRKLAHPPPHRAQCLPTVCKRTRHPAQLDFGDCFAYAPAFESGEPLRYKGNDFARTAFESTMP